MEDGKAAPRGVWSRRWARRLAASALCAVLTLLLGAAVLCAVRPERAWEGIGAVLKNFLNENSAAGRAGALGRTLARTAALLMCALGVLFARKAGLINVGAAGQYGIGAGVSLYMALALKMPWWACVPAAVLCGAAWGILPCVLKIRSNVSEVLSGFLLNRIGLYAVSALLANTVSAGGMTRMIAEGNPSALIPSLGLERLFNGEKTVTAAIPLALIAALSAGWILSRTRFGYEIKAAGLNRSTGMYSGMRDGTMGMLAGAIAGGMAALGACMLYLSDGARWNCAGAFLPAMGYHGVAAAFLGGMAPIGVLFAACLMQHLTDGCAWLARLGLYPGVTDLTPSVFVYFCGLTLFLAEGRIFRGGRRTEGKRKGGRG